MILITQLLTLFINPRQLILSHTSFHDNLSELTPHTLKLHIFSTHRLRVREILLFQLFYLMILLLVLVAFLFEMRLNLLESCFVELFRVVHIDSQFFELILMLIF